MVTTPGTYASTGTGTMAGVASVSYDGVFASLGVADFYSVATPDYIMPTTPVPISWEFESRTRTYITDALSMRRLTRRVGGQRWELTVKFPPMRPEDAAELLTFFESLQGPNGIFYIALPDFSGSAGEVVGNFVNYTNETKAYRVKSISPTTVTPDRIRTGGTLISSSGNTVYMRVALVNDVQKVTYPDDDMIRLEVDLVERL